MVGVVFKTTRCGRGWWWVWSRFVMGVGVILFTETIGNGCGWLVGCGIFFCIYI